MRKLIVTGICVLSMLFCFTCVAFADSYYYSGIARMNHSDVMYHDVPQSISITLSSSGISPATGHIYSCKVFADILDGFGTIFDDDTSLSRIPYSFVSSVSITAVDGMGFQVPCWVNGNYVYFVASNEQVSGDGTDSRCFVTFYLDIVLSEARDSGTSPPAESYPRIYDEGVFSGQTLVDLLENIDNSIDYQTNELADWLLSIVNNLLQIDTTLDNIDADTSAILTQLTNNLSSMKNYLNWIYQDVEGNAVSILMGDYAGWNYSQLMVEIIESIKAVDLSDMVTAEQVSSIYALIEDNNAILSAMGADLAQIETYLDEIRQTVALQYEVLLRLEEDVTGMAEDVASIEESSLSQLLVMRDVLSRLDMMVNNDPDALYYFEPLQVVVQPDGGSVVDVPFTFDGRDVYIPSSDVVSAVNYFRFTRRVNGEQFLLRPGDYKVTVVIKSLYQYDGRFELNLRPQHRLIFDFDDLEVYNYAGYWVYTLEIQEHFNANYNGYITFGFLDDASSNYVTANIGGASASICFQPLDSTLVSIDGNVSEMRTLLTANNDLLADIGVNVGKLVSVLDDPDFIVAVQSADDINSQIGDDMQEFFGVEDDALQDFGDDIGTAQSAVSDWATGLVTVPHFISTASFINGNFSRIWQALGDFRWFVVTSLLVGVALVFTGRSGKVR